MPELPEVETVARQLSPEVAGRRFERLRLLDPLLKQGRDWRAPAGCGGRRIARAFRHGKQILLELAPPAGGAASRATSRDPSPPTGASRRGHGGDRTTLYLAVHLRMTGRLSKEPGIPRDRRHLRAVIYLEDGVVLFRDTRRFGTLRWLTDPQQAAPGAVDPMSGGFEPRVLGELLDGSAQELKPWLLRQDRLVGLGNIYASEILHAARLAPTRPAGSLSADEVRRLHRATRQVLGRAIDNCGTTFSDFQDAHGLTGSYQQYLAVYGREGEPCPRCRRPVARVVQQQRSTFYCPACAC